MIPKNSKFKFRKRINPVKSPFQNVLPMLSPEDVDRLVKLVAAEVLAALPAPENGVDGAAGSDADEEVILGRVQEMLGQMEAALEQRVAADVLKNLPGPTASVRGPRGVPGKSPELMTIVEAVLAILPSRQPSSLAEETPEAAVRKVNASTVKIDRTMIAGLSEELRRIAQLVREAKGTAKGYMHGGGAGGKTENPSSGIVNGANTVFVFAHVPKYIFCDGGTYFEDYGYTRSGTTVTMAFAPQTYVKNAF